MQLLAHIPPIHKKILTSRRKTPFLPNHSWKKMNACMNCPRNFSFLFFIIFLQKTLTFVDMIVWQKVKNIEKPPSPFFSVDMQLFLYSSAYGNSFFTEH